MSKNIRYRMCRALEEKIRLGVGKRAIERKTGKNSPFIHSAATARTYMQQAQEYGSWLAAQGMNRCTMEQAREMAAEYIKSFESASTQHTIRSALAKVFDCRGEEICRLGKRDPADFTRGRTPTDRTAAIERNHPELAEACRSMGLRNDRELKQLTASDLHRGADGHLYAHVRGKGAGSVIPLSCQAKASKSSWRLPGAAQRGPCLMCRVMPMCTDGEPTTLHAATRMRWIVAMARGSCTSCATDQANPTIEGHLLLYRQTWAMALIDITRSATTT